MPEVREVAGTNLIVFSKFEPKYEIGATVRLRSGGPLLTVVGCNQHDVTVHWYVGTQLNGATHPIQAVKEAKRGTSVSRTS